MNLHIDDRDKGEDRIFAGRTISLSFVSLITLALSKGIQYHVCTYFIPCLH